MPRRVEPGVAPARHQGLALGRGHQAEHDAQGGGLAGAVYPDKAGHLAHRRGERHVVEDLFGAEVFGQSAAHHTVAAHVDGAHQRLDLSRCDRLRTSKTPPITSKTGSSTYGRYA
jgi:hypothetical protein